MSTRLPVMKGIKISVTDLVAGSKEVDFSALVASIGGMRMPKAISLWVHPTVGGAGTVAFSFKRKALADVDFAAGYTSNTAEFSEISSTVGQSLTVPFTNLTVVCLSPGDTALLYATVLFS